MSAPEATLERMLVRRAREAGAMALKWVSPGTVGVPDRIVILPGGRVRFVELKAPGQRPTPIQARMHDRLRALGVDVRVVDSQEGIDEVLAA